MPSSEKFQVPIAVAEREIYLPSEIPYDPIYEIDPALYVRWRQASVEFWEVTNLMRRAMGRD